jgi:radical SAM superfamily enzyme YgiQ (UPF0313 family)
MKILFVYTDINTMNQGEKTYHLGIGTLSAFLKKKGHKTDLISMYGVFKLKSIFRKIEKFNPDIIALTSDTTQFPYIKKIIKNISYLDIFTILGGVHVSLCPECISEIQGLDSICIGEGEYSLSELADNFNKKPNRYDIDGIWFKTKDGIIKNKTRPFISNIDILPYSDRELFDYQKIINSDYGRVSFMVSRGCPYSCTYCASPSMGKLQKGKYVRFMSVERAVEELKYLKSKYKFNSIFFADDTFTLNKDYVLKFCQQYKKEINIPFEVNVRVESSSLEIFKILKDAGCFKIHMGIESGHEEFRRDILNRKMTNEQIIDAFRNAKEAGLMTKSYNIVGFPYETAQIHQSTLTLNRRISPDGHVCYIFQPYPGTRLYDICKKENFIDSANFNKTGAISRRTTLLNMPQFSQKEIIKAHRNFSFQIYKNKSFKKALIYKLYYSRYGETLLRIFSPIKNMLRKFSLK